MAASQRAGEEQGAKRQRDRAERNDRDSLVQVDWSPGPDLLVEHDEQRSADNHQKQERQRFQKTIRGVIEVDLHVARRESTGRHAGQERPDTDRSGDANALEYVEGEMHRGVP